MIIAKYDSAGGAEEWRLWIDAAGKLSLDRHVLSDRADDGRLLTRGGNRMSYQQLLDIIHEYGQAVREERMRPRQCPQCHRNLLPGPEFGAYPGADCTWCGWVWRSPPG